MENNLRLEFNMVKILSLAESISKRYNSPCVTDIACFAALMLLNECPLYGRLISKGITREQISEICTKLLNKYYIFAKKQTAYWNARFPAANYSCNVSKELYEIFIEASSTAKTYYGKNYFGCNELLVAFGEILPDVFDEFLEACDMKPNSDNPFKEEDNMTIPHDLVGCLTILNNEPFANEPTCSILGREEETTKLLRILAKDTKRNAVLVGEPGVGKTALVEKLTWLITMQKCPDKFKDYTVISLDINSIVAGTMYRGQAEERFESLISFLDQNPKCILFIDEIHTLLGAGACREGDMDLANAMKPILARGKTQVIGSTTKAEYENFFSKDGALKRRFEKILVNEPKIHEIYPMIENKIDRLSKAHNVTITRPLVDKIIFYASCFNYETKNPDRTLDLIDKAMAVAELQGHKNVTLKDIFENFDTNKKMFDETPEHIKIALAYHEAGHYILHRFSDELYDHKILAVSIMPGDGYYGVNVFEINDKVIPSNTKEYYIQLIACKLAGRIAEKLYSNKLSAGASNDLMHATNIAKNMITQYGLDEELSENRVYIENPMYNDKLIDRINNRIDAIIDEAKKYAEKVLLENMDYLKLLVDALLKEGMLSGSEIDELFKSTSNV